MKKYWAEVPLKERTVRIKSNPCLPSLAEEEEMRSAGHRLIAGIDEAGRGALAGPVAAAAVILPPLVKAPWREEIRDSKLLSPPRREYLYHHIQEISLATGTGMATPDIIDGSGIVVATRHAMEIAVEMLSPPPDCLLIDYLLLPGVKLPQKGVVGGDRLCFSIACASIIAKVTRDRFMAEMDERYPGYGLAKHKGYGTRQHITCLHQMGACPIHRRSFMPVRKLGMK